MGKKVEVFTTGTQLCDDVVQSVKEVACSRCEVIIYDVRVNGNEEIAKSYNVQSFPAITINGTLANLETLKKGKLSKFLHNKVLNKLFRH